MLKKVADGVWVVEGMLAFPPLPIRATILELPEGLVIISPVEFSDADAAAIDALGKVVAIVAPSALHHLFMVAAQRRWPNAKALVSPLVAGKQPTLQVAGTLDQPWPFGPELELLLVEGMPTVQEWLFFHRPSKTLIVTDLVFNIRAYPGFVSALFARAFGTYKRLAASRLFVSFIKDRAAVLRSLERAVAFDTVTLIPAHGEIVTGTDTREQLRAALALRGLRV